jgi:hypothetical protein
MMNKLILILISISLLASITGCVDVMDCLASDEFRISGSSLSENKTILNLDVEVWSRAGISDTRDFITDNNVDILLNNEKIDFDWQNYTVEFKGKYDERIVRGHYWYLLKYEDKSLYYWDQLSSFSKPPGYWGWKCRNHLVIHAHFLLENTTLSPPILIELKNKEGKVIDSVKVNG